MNFLLLVLSLPPHPSSLRVRVWRKLRTLGAVALKNSVYLLPETPEHLEHFQWLTQEIERARGDATLLRVDRIENMKPADVIGLFQEARDRDYREVAARYRKILDTVERQGRGRRAPAPGAEFARVTRELARITEIDFFEGPGRAEAERLKEAVERRLRPAPGSSAPHRVTADAAGLRGRRWVTRPRPHVDRIASAWLVKRFIDPAAEFRFASPDEFPPDAIGFDAPGAEFSHQGEECTFETLLRRFGLRDRRLATLAEIVHEADLRDRKFPREEARGIDLAIRGLLAALKDDHEVLAHGLTLFDGLYASVGER